MRFKTDQDGVHLTVDINEFNGKTTFQADCLEGPFDSWPALDQALTRHKKQQRKDFTNTTAYVLSGWKGEVKPVKVLSIHSCTQAWILNQYGRRELVLKKDLFASSHDLNRALREKDRLEKAKGQVFDSVPRWAPIKKRVSKER